MLSVLLPGESQGWGSLVGCHLWGHTESDTTEVIAVYAFSCDTVVKNPPANAGDVSLIPGLGRSPGGRHGSPTPVFMPGVSNGQRILVSYSPLGCTESDMTEVT